MYRITWKIVLGLLVYHLNYMIAHPNATIITLKNNRANEDLLN